MLVLLVRQAPPLERIKLPHFFRNTIKFMDELTYKL